MKAMRKSVKFLVALLFSLIPLGLGSSILEAKIDHAYCTGNLTLSLVSATCSTGSCTYGSEVYLYGQVRAAEALPSNATISVYPSLPHMAFTGIMKTYEETTNNICNSGVSITPPAGDDAGYKCPSAGLYNVHTKFKIGGKTNAWWSSLYGFNIVFILTLEDLSVDQEYAKCYIEAMVKDGDGGGVSTTGAFLGGVGLSLLAAGFMFRKRKCSEIDDVDKIDDENDDDNFELLDDPDTPV